VKIGFYTALFPDLPIQSVAEWAAKENFDCLEVDFNRHIVDPAKTGQVVNTVRQVGLDVSSITLFGALLTSDRGQEQKIRDIAKELVVAAAAADVFFSGRDQSRSETENYKSLAEFLAILEDCSASHPMKILLENWPGFHKNSIATTPEGWRTLFTFVNSTRIGLEFDPSHLLIQGIETGPAYSEVQDRVFLVHAKDAKLDPEKLQDEGSWEIPNIRSAKLGFNWVVGPLPKDLESVSILGGENLALGNGNNIEEAWKFVEWLNEPARAKALIVAAGQITNREDLAGDPVWAEDPVEKIFLAAIRSAKARAYGPKYPQISEIMYTTFQSIVTGSMTPEEAAKNAEHQLQPLLEKAGS
jgi:sugar phosphate isomerase/epimerase